MLPCCSCGMLCADAIEAEFDPQYDDVIHQLGRKQEQFQQKLLCLPQQDLHPAGYVSTHITALEHYLQAPAWFRSSLQPQQEAGG